MGSNRWMGDIKPQQNIEKAFIQTVKHKAASNVRRNSSHRLCLVQTLSSKTLSFHLFALRPAYDRLVFLTAALIKQRAATVAVCVFIFFIHAAFPQEHLQCLSSAAANVWLDWVLSDATAKLLKMPSAGSGMDP